MSPRDSGCSPIFAKEGKVHTLPLLKVNFLPNASGDSVDLFDVSNLKLMLRRLGGIAGKLVSLLSTRTSGLRCSLCVE